MEQEVLIQNVPISRGTSLSFRETGIYRQTSKPEKESESKWIEQFCRTQIEISCKAEKVRITTTFLYTYIRLTDLFRAQETRHFTTCAYYVLKKDVPCGRLAITWNVLVFQEKTC